MVWCNFHCVCVYEVSNLSDWSFVFTRWETHGDTGQRQKGLRTILFGVENWCCWKCSFALAWSECCCILELHTKKIFASFIICLYFKHIVNICRSAYFGLHRAKWRRSSMSLCSTILSYSRYTFFISFSSGMWIFIVFEKVFSHCS